MEAVAIMTAAKTILVIDDEPGYRDMLKFQLTDEGHTVLTAASGPEALKVLQDNGKADMVITDMKMSPMDGLETLIAIRNVYPKMPVILMTGYALEERVQEALSRKASTCLRKPFHLDELNLAMQAI